MNKILSILLIIVVLTLNCKPVSAAKKKLSVYLNNQYVRSNMSGDILMINIFECIKVNKHPFNDDAIADAIDRYKLVPEADITYSSKSDTYTIKNYYLKISFQLGNRDAKLNGKSVRLSAAPIEETKKAGQTITDYAIYLPIDFYVQCIEGSIEKKNNDIYITTKITPADILNDVLSKTKKRSVLNGRLSMNLPTGTKSMFDTNFDASSKAGLLNHHFLLMSFPDSIQLFVQETMLYSTGNLLKDAKFLLKSGAELRIYPEETASTEYRYMDLRSSGGLEMVLVSPKYKYPNADIIMCTAVIRLPDNTLVYATVFIDEWVDAYMGQFAKIAETIFASAKAGENTLKLSQREIKLENYYFTCPKGYAYLAETDIDETSYYCIKPVQVGQPQTFIHFQLESGSYVHDKNAYSEDLEVMGQSVKLVYRKSNPADNKRYTDFAAQVILSEKQNLLIYAEFQNDKELDVIKKTIQSIHKK